LGAQQTGNLVCLIRGVWSEFFNFGSGQFLKKIRGFGSERNYEKPPSGSENSVEAILFIVFKNLTGDELICRR
jgi:hypothetical protein